MTKPSNDAVNQAHVLYPATTEAQREAAARGYDEGRRAAAIAIACSLGYEPSYESDYEKVLKEIGEHVRWLEQRARDMYRGGPPF